MKMLVEQRKEHEGFAQFNLIPVCACLCVSARRHVPRTGRPGRIFLDTNALLQYLQDLGEYIFSPDGLAPDRMSKCHGLFPKPT